jgi:hypothetical protein
MSEVASSTRVLPSLEPLERLFAEEYPDHKPFPFGTSGR